MNYPDITCEQAHEQAKQLVDGLKLEVIISKPIGHVKDDWACIKYTLSFRRSALSSLPVMEIDYHLGIGHVKYYERAPFGFTGYLYDNLSQAMRDGKEIKKGYEKEQAEIAAGFAYSQKVKPKVYEVLGAMARNGLDAIQTDFEEWAGNLGYDTDSRKAEQTYQACKEEYTKLCKVMNHKQIEELAELANQF